MTFDSEAVAGVESSSLPATAEIETSPVPSGNGAILKNDIYSPNNDLTAFFAVGMVINVIIVAAFFVWAFKQWRKK